MVQLMRMVTELLNQVKSNPVTLIWPLTLFGLVSTISLDLFQHGHTVFGSFFLLENLHKLVHPGRQEQADHTAHVAGYH